MQFVIGDATVKTHVAPIFSKLRLHDRAQAVVIAYESGLVQPGESCKTASIQRSPDEQRSQELQLAVPLRRGRRSQAAVRAVQLAGMRPLRLADRAEHGVVETADARQ
jgi:hypothetical protein